MKRISTIVATMIFVTSMAATTSWAAGGQVRGNNATGPAGDCCRATTPLAEEEVEHILYMRQEEKLARDVYLTLYDQYAAQDLLMAQIFQNIADSEQRHMDSLLRLINKYGLEDPIVDDTVGVFPDTGDGFDALYADLVARGAASYCDALAVGIDIEELDIYDIEFALTEITAVDVTRVLNNLLSGSYNHLNAFTNRTALYCQ